MANKTDAPIGEQGMEMEDLERCRELLTGVNRIYGEIDAIYDTLEQELPTLSAQGLLEKTAMLDTLMEKAQHVEGQLSQAFLQVKTVPNSLEELLAIRKNRIDKLFQSNRDLTQRAQSNQALLRHELSTMRQNRNALQGYRPPGDNRPGLIRTSF